MTRTLQDPPFLAATLARLEGLRADTPRQWGSLTAHAMVCHVLDSLRVALGEQPAQDRSNLLSRTLVKWLIVGLQLPAPKGKIRTVPEMLSTEAGDWDADMARLCLAIRRIAAGEARSPHPAFGPLSPAEWARLAASHLDHHLHQFAL